jgi:D-galactose 1-dehydrogenase
VLFTTWHSQYNAAVDEARRALSDRTVTGLLVDWKEDVRKWHPGQDWIWRAGGFGVFDPGINALSIVTRILPEPLFLKRADLFFPANADAPIAANLEFSSVETDEDLRAEFDWRRTGGETWDIAVTTQDGMRMKLSGGGARLEIDGRTAVDETPAEYERIYEHFDALLRDGVGHVDETPLRLVADAFLLGRRNIVEAFRD